jgi:peptidoglycan/LPS O-acetylase OafA/YrhL
MNASASEPADGKLIGIHALRGLAALTVACVHLTDGYARFLDDRLAAVPHGAQLAQAAVALFFVISGCVMVVSSRALFGDAGGGWTFWRRRAVRVLPPYWIATGLFVLVSMWLSLPIDTAFVARSLAFLPTSGGPESAAPFALFLWPGWTLFYELMFYALFGLCLPLGRWQSVSVCSALLTLLVMFGWLGPTGGTVIHAVTRPVILLFAAGLIAGLAIGRVRRIPANARGVLIACMALCLVIVPYPEAKMGAGWLIWAGAPALLCFAALAGVPLSGTAGRVAGTLGDASYALYLLHIPFAHAWMEIWDGWIGGPGGSIGYLATGLPLLVGLSIAFHSRVEGPMTRVLNRALAPAP